MFVPSPGTPLFMQMWSFPHWVFPGSTLLQPFLTELGDHGHPAPGISLGFGGWLCEGTTALLPASSAGRSCRLQAGDLGVLRAGQSHPPQWRLQAALPVGQLRAERAGRRLLKQARQAIPGAAPGSSARLLPAPVCRLGGQNLRWSPGSRVCPLLALPVTPVLALWFGLWFGACVGTFQGAFRLARLLRCPIRT